MISELEPVSLQSLVYTKLRDYILSGELSDGQSIVPNRLAKQLGVSITPVRDAVNRLQNEGLVKVIPRKGTYVAKPTEKDIVELFEARKVLEVYSARRVIDLDRLGFLDELASWCDKGKRAFEEQSVERFVEADGQFHRLILLHSDNSRIQKMSETINGQLELFRVLGAVDVFSGIERSNYWHTRTVDGFRRRDKAMVEAALATHIDEVMKVTIQVLAAKSARNAD